MNFREMLRKRYLASGSNGSFFQRVYLCGKIILQRPAVEFHVIEDGKMIILGAFSANSTPDGMYLDCVPEWVYPVQSGEVTTVEQVNSAKQTGDVLEVG